MGRRCQYPGCQHPPNGHSMVHALWLEDEKRFVLACEHCRKRHKTKKREKKA